MIANNKKLDMPSKPKRGVGKANGTFGELLQGVLSDDSDFLVTLPIESYSYCYFYARDTDSIRILPMSKKKSAILASKILSFYKLPTGGDILIKSELEEGKGLASSTADMIATARAIENYYNLSIPVDVLERLIREIEPTDGIMYDGIVSYYHKEVKLMKYIGECPPMTILGIDEGGEVETIEFNKKAKPFNKEEKKEYENLLSKITSGILNNDMTLIGEVASRSALINQSLHPKRTFEDIKRINSAINGLGVITAHSGTYIGILLSQLDTQHDWKVKQGEYELKKLGYDVRLFNTKVQHIKEKFHV
ncbi:GHMP family kinase ATP-binding protein [Lysinibacillus sp. JNUCC 51]|uniref:GHMP family kinase ATP-binding protein n=1 Tax=Lysinibacillus sp. JNUCC-51 TaxID=2792479 RepID=UPI001936FC91|nr:kinase [Lysinibacillus sp. JNUCC-51]